VIVSRSDGGKDSGRGATNFSVGVFSPGDQGSILGVGAGRGGADDEQEKNRSE
jgi:hypothetical protein